MSSLLKYELRKCFKSGAFRIIALLSAGLTLFGTLIIIAATKLASGDVAQMLTPLLPNNLFDVILSAFDNCELVTLSLIFATVFVTGDYSTGTIKNVVVRGYSRISIFASKVIVNVIASLIFWLIGIAVASAVNAFTIDKIGDMDQVCTFLLHLTSQLVIIMAITVIATSIAYAIRSTAGSIVLNLAVISFVPSILTTVIFGISAIDGLGFLQYVSYCELNFLLTSFRSMEPNSLSSIIGGTTDESVNLHIYAYVCSAIYMLMSGGLSGLLFKKRDIA